MTEEDLDYKSVPPKIVGIITAVYGSPKKGRPLPMELEPTQEELEEAKRLIHLEETLRPAINNLLLMYLPPYILIKEADLLGDHLYQCIKEGHIITNVEEP